jgi:hypothetical protein
MTRPTMSSRERMLAAITRQKPDHVPFSPFIQQSQWWGEPLLWRGQLDRAEKMLALGLDPTINLWFPDPQPHPDVTIKTWRDTSGPEPLLTKEYHTPAGVLRQVVRETPDWLDVAWHTPWIPTTFGAERRAHFNMDLFDDWNVSRRTEPWVKGPDDLEKLKFIIRIPGGYVLDEWRMDAERALDYARKHDLLTVARRTIVGDAFQWFCDIDDFMCRMIEAPDFVQEFLGIFQTWSLELTKLALDAGVDVVQRRGWYEIPTYWGPKYFSRYIAPLIQEETKLVHQAGKLHCYLLPEGHGVYASNLKELDVDVLMGVDPRMLHGGDFRTLFDQLGDSKSFWGGVNAEVTLQSEDPNRIEKEVKYAIESLAGNGGLILGTFVFQQISREMILYMIDAWRKYCEV